MADLNTRSIGLIGLLWFGAAAAAAMQLLLQLVIARAMGPSSYGVVAASIALVSTLAPIAAFGLPAFWLRAFGDEGAHAVRWIPASLRVAFIAVATVTGALLLWAGLGDMPEPRRLVLASLTTIVAGQVGFELVSSKLQLEGRVVALASWQVVPPLLRLLMVSALWAVSTVSPARVAVCFAIMAGLLVAIAVREISMAARGHLKIDEMVTVSESRQGAPRARELIARSWIFALDALLFLVYMQTSLVILDRVAGSAQSGVYNAAFVMLMAVNLLPGVIYQKYFAPKFHRWASHDPARLRLVYQRGNRVMLVLGIAAMISLFVIAPQLIVFTFGPAYEASVPVLRVLVLCIPLRFVSSNVGSLLVTGRFHIDKVKVMATAAVLNVVASLSLVPHSGALGAAWSAVIAEAAVLAGFLLVTRVRSALHD